MHFIAAPLLRVDQFKLTVDAFDHGTPVLRSHATVIITVNGSNAHAPQFENFLYEISVPEDMPIGTRLVQVRGM